MGWIHRHARADSVHELQLHTVEVVRGAGHQHAQRHQAKAALDHECYNSSEYQT